jgi:hypothetical protein
VSDLATAVGESIAKTIRDSSEFDFLGSTGGVRHAEYTDLAPQAWVHGATARIVVVLASTEVVSHDAEAARVAYLYDILFDGVDVRNRDAQRGMFHSGLHATLGGGREWTSAITDPTRTVGMDSVPIRIGDSGELTFESAVMELATVRVELWRRL